MKLFRVYAVIKRTHPDGWKGIRETPSFYVTAQDEREAESIARGVMDAATGFNTTVSSFAISDAGDTLEMLHG